MTLELQVLIREWSTTEDYTEGLRLWTLVHGENLTYRMLCRGDNDFNRAKLRDGLALPNVDKVVDKTIEIPKKRIEEPEIIAEWRKTTYGLMDERTLAKQRLRDLPYPERMDDRRLVAFRILGITEELDRLFGGIWYYEKHGRVPNLEVDEEETENKPQDLLNLRTYVSRTKMKIRNAKTLERKKELEGQLLQFQQRIEQIELGQ